VEKHNDFLLFFGFWNPCSKLNEIYQKYQVPLNMEMNYMEMGLTGTPGLMKGKREWHHILN
jgi:hypothetical protein